MTTGVAEVSELKGHTKPRLYTPPLPAHCDTSRDDGCPCGCGLNPDTSWGFDCCYFLETFLGWELVPYQRWLYIHALEKGRNGCGFRYRTVVILIARQNGKTKWLRGLGLWRLYINPTGAIPKVTDRPAAKTVVISAQGLEYAEATLSEVVEDVKDCGQLAKEFIRYSQTNGKHRMILRGRRSWRAVAANRKAARSLSVDLAELDELREHHDWLAWDAIVPTTTSRLYSQTVAASNAGDKRSVVLRSLRDEAIARILGLDTDGASTGLFEWSAPDDVHHLERKYWPMANPGLGYLPGHDEEGLAAKAEAKASDVAGFKTEHLCQWVDTLSPGIIPAEDWQATMDPESRRADGALVYAGVDVNFQRSRAYISIAARRPDGRLHIEVVAAMRGTDGIIPWFVKRPEKFKAVAVQARGAPASGLIADMLKADIPVMEWGGAELTAGCGHMFDLIRKHAVLHRPSPVLDTAAAGTQAKSLGDAWAFDRKNSPVDAAPLIAATAAAWAESQPEPDPGKTPNVHEWPDEEEMAQWETEELGP